MVCVGLARKTTNAIITKTVNATNASARATNAKIKPLSRSWRRCRSVSATTLFLLAVRSWLRQLQLDSPPPSLSAAPHRHSRRRRSSWLANGETTSNASTRIATGSSCRAFATQGACLHVHVHVHMHVARATALEEIRLSSFELSLSIPRGSNQVKGEKVKKVKALCVVHELFKRIIWLATAVKLMPT